jgi:hypothetical protein
MNDLLFHTPKRVKIGQIWKRQYEGVDYIEYFEITNIIDSEYVTVRELIGDDSWDCHVTWFGVRFHFVQGPT